MTFDDFYFDHRLLDGLDAMGFTKPTPIQEKAIPIILDNRDFIGCAQTGTGKTAAYVLPIIDKILYDGHHGDINTLILVPTRELAQQIDQQIEGLAYFTGVSSIAVYGGGDGATFDTQRKAMLKGADIVIATPGRLISLLGTSGVKLNKISHLVLDEADRMLDMGFHEDILKIISHLPEQRQTLLFSATMPPKIRTLAARILKDPEQVNIAISKPAEGISQQAYLCFDGQKVALIKDIFKTGNYQSAIIFASTRENVKKLDTELQKAGLKTRAFHSDLGQEEREELLRSFRNKQVSVLIGTDVISRGIDVEGIDLVVNFDVPADPEDYIHRIGRTARAETTGTAITLINDRDQRKFFQIESLIGKEIEKKNPPEFLGKGPEYQPEKRSSSAGFARKSNPHADKSKSKRRWNGPQRKS